MEYPRGFEQPVGGQVVKVVGIGRRFVAYFSLLILRFSCFSIMGCSAVCRS
jgi:hypothetical protein